MASSGKGGILVDLIPDLDSFARGLKTADWIEIGAAKSAQFAAAFSFFTSQIDQIFPASGEKQAVMKDFFMSHLGNLVIFYGLAMGSHVFNGNESKAVQVTEMAVSVCAAKGGAFAGFLANGNGRMTISSIFMVLHTGFGEERVVKRKGQTFNVKYTPFRVLFANIALHGGASAQIKSYETKVAKFCRQKTGMTLSTNLIAEILGKWDEISSQEDRILAQYFQKMLIYEGRKTDATRTADRAAFASACSRILAGEISEPEGRSLLIKLSASVVGSS